MSRNKLPSELGVRCFPNRIGLIHTLEKSHLRWFKRFLIYDWLYASIEIDSLIVLVVA